MKVVTDKVLGDIRYVLTFGSMQDSVEAAMVHRDFAVYYDDAVKSPERIMAEGHKASQTQSALLFHDAIPGITLTAQHFRR